MSQVNTVNLDNEAVAACNVRRSASVGLVVPTAVRVEAGWDRGTPQAAAINRLRIGDAVLDGRNRDLAAAARKTLDVSVADAHIAAVLEATDPPHAVVTSDSDLHRVARHLGISANIVRICPGRSAA